MEQNIVGRDEVEMLFSEIWNKYADALVKLGETANEQGLFDADQPLVDDVLVLTERIREFVHRGPNGQEVMDTLSDNVLEPLLPSFMKHSYNADGIAKFRTLGVKVAIETIQQGIDRL